MRRGKQTHYTCPVCGSSIYVADDGSSYCGKEPDCEFSRLSPQLTEYVATLHAAESIIVMDYPKANHESDYLLDKRDDMIIKALGIVPGKSSNCDSSGLGESGCQIGD